MKLNKLIIAILVLLTIPLVLGVTVTTKSYYSPTENITFTGTCNQSNNTVGLQINQNLTNLWFEEVITKEKKFTFIWKENKTKGKYTIYVTCNNEKRINKEICLGTELECIGKIKKAQEDKSSGTSGGGGGSRCIANWSCSTWSWCNSSLEQTRTCYDYGGCEKTKVETKNCTACEESWICGYWSECSLGTQSRNCYDEHKCGTYLLKPAVSKACNAVVTGPLPTKVTSTIPPPTTSTTTKQPTVQTTSFWVMFWNNYGLQVILGIIVIVLIIIVILLFLYFRQAKTEVENIDELRDWVGKEIKANVSKDKIKDTIKQSTGWTDEDVYEEFPELKSTFDNKPKDKGGVPPPPK